MNIDELLEAPSPLGSTLQAGVESISSNQKITFTRYVRLVLPLDGFVFWVRADILSDSAVMNVMRVGGVPLNRAPTIETPAATFAAKGSLHYATDTRQEETETYSANRVLFTAEQEVQNLSDVDPQTLWVGEFQGLRFAFSSRGSFYKQASLWHYSGFAVYSDMATQLIDSVEGFNARDVIVSNSLPLWLALNSYVAAGTGLFVPTTLYPSFVLPSNIEPPFASVHVVPDATQAIGLAPLLSSDLSHSQLSRDRVILTTYGLRNAQVLDLLDTVLQYSLDTDAFGIMSQPVPRDEKRTQTELNVVGQKKIIEFEVSYYQSTSRKVARQLILSVVPTFIIRDL